MESLDIAERGRLRRDDDADTGRSIELGDELLKDKLRPKVEGILIKKEEKFKTIRKETDAKLLITG